MTKVRLRRDVLGDFHGPRRDGMYGARKGDIIDVPDRDALRYMKIDLVELKLEGEFLRGEQPNAADIAKLEKRFRDEDAKEAKKPKPRTRDQTYGGVTYVYPNDEFTSTD